MSIRIRRCLEPCVAQNIADVRRCARLTRQRKRKVPALSMAEPLGHLK